MKTFLKKFDQLISYKIIVDILVLALIFFSLLLLAESILPQLVITYVSFLKIFSVIIFALILAIFLGKRHNIHYDFETKNARALLISAFALFIFIMLVSQKSFHLFHNIVITATSTFIAWLLLKALLEEK